MISRPEVSLSGRVASVGFALLAFAGGSARGDEAFERKVLETRFLSEGVAIADVNRDGKPDVIAGPYWFEGPDFKKKHELRAPLAYDIESYSDTFIAMSRDFDGDGWPDVMQIAWPGREALWYKNPGAAGGDWPRNVAFPAVGAESPALLDFNGDGKPKLVFVTAKKVGWATPDPKNPKAEWSFHPISPEGKWERYTHGIGMGDINGDGRPDILMSDGWWEQPASLAGDPVWKFHPAPFGTKGGAHMFAYDVNNDGRADVITSLDAHGYGLSWFEQLPAVNGEPAWKEHVLLSRDPAEKIGGLQFSQLHAMAFTDIDGDGLPDIVVGKRKWAHGTKGDPEPNAPAGLYWFKLRRGADGTATFEPRLIDAEVGVGTQFEVGDLNGDGLPDIAISNKGGVSVLIQRRK
jgi:hypothetical protein